MQRFFIALYFDAVIQTIQGGRSSTIALKGSTEEEQSKPGWQRPERGSVGAGPGGRRRTWPPALTRRPAN